MTATRLQEIEFVEVPAASYLMVDGAGDPNVAPAYAEAVETLYAVAYTLRFARRRAGVDVKVGPLEGLWWSEGPLAFDAAARARWSWTLMIGQPPDVTAQQVDDAVADVRRRKRPAALDRLRLDTLREGLCAQVLHVGPFADEPATVERLRRFIDEHGLVRAGRHHEVYLRDPRRTAPERLRTILREPVRRR
jgi:hypothetical protein